MPNVEPLREGDPAAVGPYRLVGRLGAGGHGVVYLGQARNGTPVAVKVLREGLTVDERLARAIAAARKVEPFCLAQVLDASTSGRPYIVAEYVDGPSLQQTGRHGGTELQRLAVATATALDAIHQAGVVHGDFTPSNVLLGPDGARVVDFGLAGALSSGMKATSNIVGTPAYMAPEQLAGRPVGAAADVFSWASVIVYATTGRPPFGDDSLPAVINRILREDPKLGDLPGPLRQVVPACLAKDPGARPAMRDVLLRLAAPSRRPSAPAPAPAPPPQTPEQSWDQTPDRSWEPPADRSRAQDRGSDRAWEQTADLDAVPPHGHAPGHAPGHQQSPGHSQAAGHAQTAGHSQAGTPRRPHDVPRRHPARRPVSDPHEAQDAHDGSSPLQALFDLSSPVEQPAGDGPQGGQSMPLGAPVATGPGSQGSHVPVGTTGPLGVVVASDQMVAPPGKGGGQGPPPRSRGRRVKTVLIAGVSGVCVLALAGAIIWLTPTTPTPKTSNVSGNSSAPATDAGATPSSTPRPTRTRNTNRPTPQSDGTPSAVTSDDPAANRLRLVYIRPNGTKNGTCWSGGEVTLQALVQRTGAPVTFSYTWIIDGVTTSRASAIISENGRRYLASPRTLQSTGGTHNVTLRITAPTTAQRTISVAMCEDGL
ncbi:Serine/threonine protein kinase [Nonomuraea solani]|uniref:non-specific serine/threonine protein kinase n=1 Tax=Nonomuraea solani TaxID=1144553 RepID=A0A1H6EQE8_9ACTN|nr:serine/threonine-protein kinase [Nonomuraea solani]SEH00088.1 Serine/threonine protein kinase [Nonomuraea solani]